MLALWMVLQRGWRTRHWWTPSAPPIDHTHHRFMLSLQRRTRPIQHARSSRQQTYNTTSLFFVWLSPLVVGDWNLQHDRGKSRDRVADSNPPRQAGRAQKGVLYVGRVRTHCSTKENLRNVGVRGMPCKFKHTRFPREAFMERRMQFPMPPIMHFTHSFHYPFTHLSTLSFLHLPCALIRLSACPTNRPPPARSFESSLRSVDVCISIRWPCMSCVFSVHMLQTWKEGGGT